MYAVFLADSRVEKELEDLPTYMRKRIERAIFKLEEDPRPQGFRVLSGQVRGTNRVRVDDWRIFYDIDDTALSVYITAIRHRREAYR